MQPAEPDRCAAATHLVATEPLMPPQTDLDAVVTTAATERRPSDLGLLVTHPEISGNKSRSTTKIGVPNVLNS